jgi:rare lipoprotein A
MRHTFFALLSGFFLNMAFIFPTSLQAEEFGKAGYYANSLHGRKTASGEKYDKNELTCAHKTLPFGTKVRVTRLDNKRSVVVRVNDRGPYSAGYIVDLSRKAAEELDIIKAGNARVKVEVLEDESLVPIQHSTPTKVKTSEGQMTMLKPKKTTSATTAKGGKALRPATYSTTDPEPASGAPQKAIKSDLYKVDIKSNEKKGFGVQVSTLYDANNVLPIVTKLQKQWAGKVLVDVAQDDANRQTTYKVIIGPYGTKTAAEETQRTAARQGHKRCFVVALNEM